MITYDYECNACSHSFSLRQSIKAKKKRKCPECGKRALIRIPGRGLGVLFKGEGFHKGEGRGR